MKAVDALYTAIGLKDPKLVADCEATLKHLHESGQAGDPVYRSLDAVIAEAKGGAWEPAYEHLAQFIDGQTR